MGPGNRSEPSSAERDGGRARGVRTDGDGGGGSAPAERDGTTAGTPPPTDPDGGPTATSESAAAPLPPGPDGYPLVGNAPAFLRDPFGFYDRLHEYGDVVRWGFPGFPYTTVFHPDHVEQVLVEDHDRFDRNLFENFSIDFAPEGLFFTEGEQWRRQRRLLQSAFTMDRIEGYADAMAATAARTAAAWNDGQVVHLDDAFGDLTLSILARTLFDVDLDPTGEDAAITRAAAAINRRGDPTNLGTFLPTWLPTPGNRRYRHALSDFRGRVDDLVARRRRGEGDERDADDLLSLLLAAGDDEDATLSDAEIRDNLVTFLFAGHETTALGLTYAVLLLASHEEQAARLRAELDAELDGDRPGLEDLDSLTYTDQVISEALRLHPPAHLLIRRATADTTIGGYRVPAGTFVTLPQFYVHTDERWWDDPEAFRPDRFADGAADGPVEPPADSHTDSPADRPSDNPSDSHADSQPDRPEYAYFPFGGGPRHCIGMRFARLELRLVLAELARSFEFELLSDPDPAISSGITHRPKDPVRVRVHRR